MSLRLEAQRPLKKEFETHSQLMFRPILIELANSADYLSLEQHPPSLLHGNQVQGRLRTGSMKEDHRSEQGVCKPKTGC